METENIRRNFLKYFQNNQHRIVPSSPVVPHDDPTLLFTNAGMNQFKDVFLGKSLRDYSRATTSQKCIRVGGKHNDLENVGHTLRHLTFFEMLGNFSFGDYFKKDAIRFAWEVTTEVFGFDGDRVWPTVFRDDDEAFELWREFVPENRITRFGESENFWSMGDTGPCGPCSELLYDRGPKYSPANNPTEDAQYGGERFLEFWNLVFMQYNRTEDGSMLLLPKPSVDTGAGIERVVSLKMDVKSVFETDILRSIISQIEAVTGKTYDPNNEQQAPAFRVIADHLRCLSFAIADGVQPSNVDRGYVLRKVLRRAVRYGRTLGMDKPFLAQVLPRLIETMGEDYKELVKSQDRIAEILTIEEESFLRTLRRGGNILNHIIEHANSHGKIISGDEAFKLKDTYGLPIDEILLLAKDGNLSVDTKRYEELESEAKERSRKAHKTTKQEASVNLFEEYLQKQGPSEFVGYTNIEAEAKVTAIVVDNTFVDEAEPGQDAVIVLNKTPFYAEMGGQIFDTGTLFTPSSLFKVNDCQSPFKGVIAHIGTVEKGKIKVGDVLKASIDAERRQKIANNHTATHLLHWALYLVLGEHIKQAGSVVDPSRLRFDFTHHKGLTQEDIRKIEDLVNEKIRQNQPVSIYELSYEDAQSREDIKQFFGDKYDSKVRVIDIDYSKELCGGTHTSSVGNIGLFRIAKESSIAAGIRRIEAVTGAEAEALTRQTENLLNTIAEKLKSQPQMILSKIEKILEDSEALEKEIKECKKQAMGGRISTMLDKIEMINNIKVLSIESDIPAKEMRDFADATHEQMGSGILMLGSTFDGDRCQLIIKVSNDLVNKGIKALDLIKAIAPIIDGSGGGKADTAQAGGKCPKKIGEAFTKAKQLLGLGDAVP